ncbi:MAG: class I SAM-dependent methyltransferase [Melioribacteraceae bacterium]|nr:class I SAM-dependent methyltransferase [Melioribacteraceae bacterium]
MRFMTKHASNESDANFSFEMRKKRFSLFLRLINKRNLKQPKILDVGGTETFWNLMNSSLKTDFSPTLFNKHFEKKLSDDPRCIQGDATNLSIFSDQEFDVAFSNSVIEHLETFENQKKMADEIQRVSRFHFIQTPSFFFPFEPHFLFPMFHWLPLIIRARLLQYFNLGWFPKTKNFSDSLDIVKEIRLLSRWELKKLFPHSKIYFERFWGLTKSYTVSNL